MLETSYRICSAAIARAGRSKVARRSAAALAAGTTAAALLFVGNASASIVPTVPLGTSANYAVLGGSTVTNTGATVLNGSLGLWPGTSVTGAPMVVPPATTDVNNAVAQQAQSDLTVGYDNAAGRSIDQSTPADLANLHLAPGVYAGPAKSALLLSGPLTLDGGGDPAAVFIFQTNSTLTTASASTVNLINGAQECNVFWQVGSSATLGTGSAFTGSILALTSITVNTSVVVHGRALARNGAVTLDTDTFLAPTCATAPPASTTTAASAPTTTAAPAATTSTTAAPAATTSTTAAPAATTSTTAAPGATTSTTGSPAVTSPTTVAPAATTSTTAPAATTSTTAAPAATTSTTARAATTSTTAAAAAGSTSTTQVAGTPVVTVAAVATTQLAATATTVAPITALGITPGTVPANGSVVTPATPANGVPSEIITTATGSTTPALPRTGAPISTTVVLAVMALTLGVLATRFGRARA